MKQYFIRLACATSSLVLIIFILAHSSPDSVSKLQKYYLEDTSGSQPQDVNGIAIEEYIRGGALAQNDFRIINYIRNNGYLRPPQSVNTPYNLKSPFKDPSMGQSQIVKRLFHGKRHGFFVECGGLDGETRSNTLSLERDFGWEGLLVEGDPKNYQILVSKNRKAWTAGCCLAVHPYPHEVMFMQNFNMGKIDSEQTKDSPKPLQQNSFVKVQCFPLFSILSTMGVNTVDYFSLDVEGFEMDVLETIPFHLLNISVLSVEFLHGKGGADEITSFMANKGYRVVTKLTHGNNLANDVIFAHSSFPVTEEFPKLIRSEQMKLD